MSVIRPIHPPDPECEVCERYKYECFEFPHLAEEEEGWTYVSIGGAVVLILIWAWLMVVLLHAALG